MERKYRSSTSRFSLVLNSWKPVSYFLLVGMLSLGPPTDWLFGMSGLGAGEGLIVETFTTPGSMGEFVEMEPLTDQSLRGVSVVSDQVVWVSGAGGSVFRTLDGGDSWTQLRVPETESVDFRDVHAFDEKRACLMVAGSPARLYHTADGGMNWTIALEDRREGAFFDAMEFWDERRGIAFGDAIDGHLVIALTQNGGETWTLAPQVQCPAVFPDEHGYAASGSCLEVFGEQGVLIGLGGGKESKQPSARVVISFDRGQTWEPRYSGLGTDETAGIFSVEALDEQNFVAVGGDYLQEENTAQTVSVSADGGKTWVASKNETPAGFRSDVKRVGKLGEANALISVGPNGVDYSNDRGQTWKPIASRGYHAVSFSADGQFGWAVGAEGRMGKWKPFTDRN